MCRDCRSRRALPPSQSVVALCEDCIAANTGGFYGRPGETPAEIRARQRAHYSKMLDLYGYRS